MQRGYRSLIDAKIADERSGYDLAWRSSRLMATRQPCTFVGSSRKDGSRKLANDLARAGSSHLTMANEAIHRNIRGLGSDRAYFISKIRTEYTRMQAFARRRFDGIAISNRMSRFRASRDGKSRSPAIPFVRRRRTKPCDGSRIASFTRQIQYRYRCFFRSGYVGRRCSALAGFDVRYFAIKNYRERCIIILSITNFETNTIYLDIRNGK